MPRLFTALELPPAVRTRLAMVRAPIPGARWIRPDNLHLTLRFFGDMPSPTARELMDELATVQSLPFDIEIKACGVFGGRQPSTLYAALAPCAELDALRRTHERIARRLGLPDDGHPFHPHITLARLRYAPSHSVAAFLEAYGTFRLPPIRIESFVVMSARPNTGGGPYAIEAHYAFEVIADDDWDDEEAAATAIQWDSRF